jgi:hypothetical protein
MPILPPAPRHVLDIELSAETIGQFLREQPGDGVGLTAGRTASDRLAPAPFAKWPAMRQRPRPDAEIDGGEVSG